MANARGKNRQRQREGDQYVEGCQQAFRTARREAAEDAAADGGPQEPACEHRPQGDLGAAEEHKKLAHEDDLRGDGGEADEDQNQAQPEHVR